METIEQAMAREARRLRQEAGVGQPKVAESAREFGLTWTHSTVADLEAGRRRYSLGEMVLLPSILERAGVTRGIALTATDLIADGDEPVEIAPGLALSRAEARELLTVRGATVGPEDVLRTPSHDQLAIEACQDAEQGAALALKVKPRAVVGAARRLWGKSLTARREDLVAQESFDDLAAAARPDWPRRLQALRGHATRRLLEELRPHLKRTRGKKGAKS